MNADGSAATRLTFTTSTNQDPRWSPDEKRIAFSARPAVGGTEIYVMNADGSGVVQLTATGPSYNRVPSWSKDGSRIAFVSDRSGDPEIYVMNADGSNVTRLSYSPGLEWSPVWSPDGRRIAFVSERLNPGLSQTELYTMDPDGSRVTRLTLEHEFILGVTWEPKGRQIAYSHQNGIVVISVDGTQSTKISDGGASGGWDPSWSPDGRRIAFTSARDGKYEIYTMDPDGSAQTRITSSPGANSKAEWGR
jgi:Tol biopolymer transport system component